MITFIAANFIVILACRKEHTLEMKKILYISNILAHINSFHIPYIEMLRKNGYDVDVIANSCGELPKERCYRYYDVPIERSPFSPKNLSAYGKIKNIIDGNEYDLIHVHTPMGSVLGRLAAKRARKRGTKVIYTSHGFHFYKGAPIFNNIVYYCTERYLSKYTDAIIVINKEDFNAAKKFVPDDCKLFFMNGVGVDLSKCHCRDKERQAALKKQYGYEQNVIVLYAAEFIKRKNHKFLITAFSEVFRQHPDVRLLLAGKGPLQKEMQRLTDSLGLNECISFLGYRRDVPELLKMADFTVSTSRQEGFPINVAESIASYVPAVVSDIRGNTDIIENGYNGLLYRKNDKSDFISKAGTLIHDSKLRETMSVQCEDTAKKIDINRLVSVMKEIYSNYIEFGEN